MIPTRPSLSHLVHRMALAALLGSLPLRGQPRHKAAPPPPAAVCMGIGWRPAEGHNGRLDGPGLASSLEAPRPGLRLVPVAAQAAPSGQPSTGPGLDSGCRF